MKKQGTIAKWDDARGFGFIRSPASTADVFFHVRDYQAGSGGMPRQGLAVTFEEIHVGGKGPRGMQVRPAGAAPSPSPSPARPVQRAPHARTARSGSGGGMGALLAMMAYAAMIGWAVWAGKLPAWILVALAALNLFTFMVYWQDKHAAESGEWRVKEKRLHLLALAGGWPGAWFAHQLLRHKSKKAEFRAVYWATVTVHCALVGAWLWQA